MNGNFELRHWRWRPKPLAIPPALDLHKLPPRDGDVELNHWDAAAAASVTDGGGYTSLRDLISSPTGSIVVNSPTPSCAYEIQIKNRLLKHAAYAYLQPTPSSTEASSRRRRFSLRRAAAALSCGLSLGPCFDFIKRFFRTIRIRKER